MYPTSPTLVLEVKKHTFTPEGGGGAVRILADSWLIPGVEQELRKKLKTGQKMIS